MASQRAARAAAGLFAGFALIAATNAIAIPVFVPMPPAGLSLRVAHHAFDLAETLGLGLVAAACASGAILAFRGRLAPLLVLYAAAASAIMELALGRDLQRQALVALDGTLTTPLHAVFTVLCGLAIVAAHLLGAFFSRYRKLRALPLVVALGGVVTNHLLVPDDYPGLHGAIAWTAATLAGATIAPTVLRWMERAWARGRGGRAALCGLGLTALLGVVVPPSNATRLQLFREPGSSAAWVLAATLWREPSLGSDEPAPASPWFADRSGLPDVPPTSPPLVRESPVVVLVTIDATRANDVLNPQNDSLFPSFARLRKTGATFTYATTPGSQTSVSLTTAFSGRYFSELVWGMHGVGAARFDYAADDPTPRFPALLTDHGVSTENFCPVNFFAGDFGVVRGFATERIIPKDRRHALAREVLTPLLARLRKAKGGEALFLYAHLMEPHSPYDRGSVKTGEPHDRYLAEIAVADAELGRIMKLLDTRFASRGYLIVASDHGEAFGEHDTTFHTKTLYEELLRVPLFVRGPGVVRRTIDQHVGLIDLGPTLLDLFGASTPATFMGQSLVPLLAGEDVTLDRPLLAEGRLRRALYHGKIKVIDDPRRKVAEAYDLASDPGEMHNLVDEDPARAAPAFAALRAYFAAKAYTKDGYTPPFKP